METLKWSLAGAKKSFCGGLVFGLIAGLIFGLTYELTELTLRLIIRLYKISDRPIPGISVWLTSELGIGLITGLITGLSSGIKGPGIAHKTKPNQGLWKSARNAGIVAPFFGLIVGVVVDVTIGLIAGLITGLISGGSACLRHFSLRLMLYRMGYLPWNYARFLDYAAERLFLQKVGGGYIFIHRMLLEHFAQMTLEQKGLK